MTLARGSLGTLSSLSRAIIEPIRMYACTFTRRNVQSAFCIYCSSKSDEKLRAFFPSPVMKQFPGLARRKRLSYSTRVCADSLRWKSDEVARNLSIKARQKVRLMITGSGWNSTELTSPPERLRNRMLPLWQSHHLICLTHLALLHLPQNAWHVLIFRCASLHCQHSSQGECCTFPVLSLRCHYLLFHISPFLGSVKRTHAPKSGSVKYSIMSGVCACIAPSTGVWIRLPDVLWLCIVGTNESTRVPKTSLDRL